MSTIDKQGPWSKIPSETLDSKYEKCRHITEEIYKRINITFQIKKLETAAESDVSDASSEQIDSNELSNETDLFACDKSSLSSSSDAERLGRGAEACEKYININNNEEQLKAPAPAPPQPVVVPAAPTPALRRPRKRFRKRVKKQQRQRRGSEGSSDEGPPLSQVAGRAPRAPHSDPTIVKSPSADKKVTKKSQEPKAKPKTQPEKKQIQISENMLPIIPIIPIDFSQRHLKVCKEQDDEKVQISSIKCSLCGMQFRGERGLRRHMSITHPPQHDKQPNRTEQRDLPT